MMFCQDNVGFCSTNPANEGNLFADMAACQTREAVKECVSKNNKLYQQ